MELNAEINKVVGKEIAQVLAARISDDEIQRLASQAWADLRASTVYRRSDLDIESRKAIIDRYNEAIADILDTEEAKEFIHEEAEKIVQEIREEVHRKTVESISSKIVLMYAGEGGYGLKTMIAETVQEMLRR